MSSLEGKVALITGAARGQGAAEARLFAQRGAKVMLCDLLDDEGQAVAAEIGANAAYMRLDVTSESDWKKVVQATVDKFGKLNVLINNAGIIRDGLLATMSSEDWQAVIDTNLTSVFNFCQAVTRPMMSKRYGRIINMSSVAAHFGNSGQSNYAASKGGIIGFTRCLATEVAKRGITVNAVAPGFIETDMTVDVRNAAGDQIKKHIPTRRLGLPEDIANAVLFFACEDASYVTGQTLAVDGGLTLGGI
jgi:3-oxoacyl-[acyl-carrier protein] reductase